MTSKIDLTNKVFGAWTVLKFSESRPIGGKGAVKPFWLCRCACGTKREVEGASLRHGLSVSCGCEKGPAIARARTKHGHTTPISPTYWTWQAMRARVKGTNEDGRRYYKGKGIKVCERWKSFVNFLSDMGERPEGKTLDRFPNKNGNYEPGNCRWATVKQQANNTNSNVFIVHAGKCQTISQWSDELGISSSTISRRVLLGETDPKKIFALPKKYGSR